MESEFFDRGNPARRCTAHRKNGQRCRKWAIRGGQVCTHHGGRAKKTVERARRRLAESADLGAQQLLKLAFDEKQPAELRLKATLQLLDRAGVNAKTSVEVEVTARPPWETIMDAAAEDIMAESRAEYRARTSHPNPVSITDSRHQLTARNPDSIVDAEIISLHPAANEQDIDGVNDYRQPGVHGADERAAGSSTAAGTNPFNDPRDANRPSDNGMMSFEDAVAAQADIRRQISQTQRALPPGHPATESQI